MNSQTLDAVTANAPGRSLPARFAGILFAPRATYACVAAQPRWFGIFAAVFLISASAAVALLSTDAGRSAVSGVAYAVFNAALGRDATFTQVFAIVAHSGVVLACLSLFTTPLADARGSLASATSLAVFLPFLEDTGLAARLLGAIDLVFIWWIVSLAIGLGVLYRQRTGPIATAMLAVYAAIGVIVAAVKTASTGV